MTKYILPSLMFLVILLVSCSTKLGRQPDMPIDSSASVGTGSAISAPINIADPSIIITVIAILGIGVIGFAALAVLGIALWQRNTRHGRRKQEKEKKRNSKKEETPKIGFGAEKCQK